VVLDMDNEEIAFLRELRQTYINRLRILELKNAEYGINSPPEIQTEINRIKREIKSIDNRIVNPEVLENKLNIVRAIVTSYFVNRQRYLVVFLVGAVIAIIIVALLARYNGISVGLQETAATAIIQQSTISSLQTNIALSSSTQVITVTKVAVNTPNASEQFASVERFASIVYPVEVINKPANEAGYTHFSVIKRLPFSRRQRYAIVSGL
jgi:hypothetical protein